MIRRPGLRAILIVTIAALMAATGLLVQFIVDRQNRGNTRAIAEALASRTLAGAETRVLDLIATARRQAELIVQRIPPGGPVPSRVEMDLHPSLPNFRVFPEFAYFGLGCPDTGDYVIFRRTRDGAPGIRRYGSTPGGIMVRDYVATPDGPKSSGESRPSDYDFRKRPFFQKMMETQGAVWTASYPFWPANEWGDRPGITYVLPVRDETGKLKAVVDVDLELSGLSNFLSDVDRDIPGYAVILEEADDGRRRVIGHPVFESISADGGSRLRGRLDEIDDPVVKELASRLPTWSAIPPDRSQSMERLDCMGESWITAVRPIRGPRTPKWTLICLIPERELAGLGGAPRDSLLQGMLAAGLIGVIAFVPLSVWIVAPVVRLSEQARELALGGRGLRWNDRGLAELGELSRSLSAVDAAIVRREAELTSAAERSLMNLKVLDEARAATERSQARLLEVLRSTSDAILMIRVTQETPSVDEINPALAALVGLDTREAVGRSISAVLPAPFAQEVIRRVEYCRRMRESSTFEFEVRTTIGPRWLNSVLTPAADSDGVVRRVALFARDLTDRRQLEERLAEREQLWRSHAEHTPLAMIRFDDGGIIREWNPAAERIFGWPAAEIVGRPWTDLVPEGSRRAIEEDVWKRILSGAGGARSLNANITRSGMLITCDWYNAAVLDAAGVVRGVASLAMDVTERERTRLAVEASERKFSTVFQLSPMSLALIRAADGVYVDANLGFERFTGRDRIAVIGRGVDEVSVLSPSDRAKVIEDLRHGQVRDREFRIVRPDGGTAVGLGSADPLTIDGEPHILFASIDITERERAVEEIERSRARFRTLFELAPIAVTVSDVENGAFLEVSPGFTRLTGWTREEALGRTGAQLGLYEEVGGDRQGRLELLRKLGRVDGLEREIRARDGGKRAVLTSIGLFEFEGRTAIVTCGVDISERRAAELALREANEKLEARVADRTRELEAVNRELEAFCYSVSHDLRAPLRSIEGFSRAIEEDAADRLDPESLDHLSRVRAATRRMGELIDDLLDLSRVSRAPLEQRPVSITDKAIQIVESLKRRDPLRRVDVEIEPELTAHGDPSLVRVVLENLLGNAWKYTAKTDSARIELKRAPDFGPEAFVVRDNCAGFDPAFAGKLFAPFQRLHRQDEFEGHGIGLATVQRIILRHGGRITGEGFPGRGAAFRFEFGSAPARGA